MKSLTPALLSDYPPVAWKRCWSPVRKLRPSGTSGPVDWRPEGRGSGGAGRPGPRKARPSPPRGGGWNSNVVVNVVASFVDNVHDNVYDKEWGAGGDSLGMRPQIPCLYAAASGAGAGAGGFAESHDNLRQFRRGQ